MKAYEETWRVYNGVAGRDDVAIDGTRDIILENAGFTKTDDARVRLAAQAPAMARLLIAVLNRVNDPLATEISDVLDAAGVIKVERWKMTL